MSSMVENARAWAEFDNTLQYFKLFYTYKEKAIKSLERLIITLPTFDAIKHFNHGAFIKDLNLFVFEYLEVEKYRKKLKIELKKQKDIKPYLQVELNDVSEKIIEKSRAVSTKIGEIEQAVELSDKNGLQLEKEQLDRSMEELIEQQAILLAFQGCFDLVKFSLLEQIKVKAGQAIEGNIRKLDKQNWIIIDTVYSVLESMFRMIVENDNASITVGHVSQLKYSTGLVYECLYAIGERPERLSRLKELEENKNFVEYFKGAFIAAINSELVDIKKSLHVPAELWKTEIIPRLTGAPGLYSLNLVSKFFHSTIPTIANKDQLKQSHNLFKQQGYFRRLLEESAELKRTLLDLPDDNRIKLNILMIGSGNSGKNQLYVNYYKQKFNELKDDFWAGTICMHLYTLPKDKFRFGVGAWVYKIYGDFAKYIRFNHVSIFRSRDIIILTVDLTDLGWADKLETICQRIKDYASFEENKRPYVIFAGTKSDDFANRKASYDEIFRTVDNYKSNLLSGFQVAYIETSAKENIQVSELFEFEPAILYKLKQKLETENQLVIKQKLIKANSDSEENTDQNKCRIS